MYIEFNNELMNSRYIGRVKKVNLNKDDTTVYALQYELMNGSNCIKEFDSESDRDSEYEALKSES